MPDTRRLLQATDGSAALAAAKESLFQASGREDINFVTNELNSVVSADRASARSAGLSYMSVCGLQESHERMKST